MADEIEQIRKQGLFAKVKGMLTKPVARGRASVQRHYQVQEARKPTGYQDYRQKEIARANTQQRAVLGQTIHEKIQRNFPQPSMRKFQDYNVTQRQRAGTGKVSKQEMVAKRMSRLAFPVIPEGAMVSRRQGTGAKPGGGRGRPKGSLDPRYARFGGVFGYRKYQSEQRRAFREQLQQQEELAKQQKMLQRMPGYEQQQYNPNAPQQEQVPQEVAGAQPDYTQYEQIQGQVQQYVPQPQYQPQSPPQRVQPRFHVISGGQAVQQPQPQQYVPQPQMYPQQMPVEAQGRPEMFKRFGGRAYPPVQRNMLQSLGSAPPGYKYVIDLMTSKPILQKLPIQEKWSQTQR